MARRYYSSIAVPTTLVLSVTDSQTTFSLNASTGFPSSYPYTLLIDEDTAYEELVTVTAALGGNQFTVTRGSDGTTAQAHAGGAAVRHAYSARDLDEPNAHIAASSAVHGLSGTVVGTTDTQTLTNKTLTSPTVNNPTLVLKQSASPTPTAEGDVQWDTDDNTLKVGDGASTKTISPDDVSATLTNKTLTTPTIASFTNATHDHSNAAGGGALASPTIVTPTLTLKQSSSPTPTAEGDIQWDTDDNRIAVGDGAATKIISPDTVAATLSSKTLDDSCVVPARSNVLINSHFDVWQRGTSFAIPSSATWTQVADRWAAWRNTNTGCTVSRQTGPTGQTYALRMQRDNGDSNTQALRLGQVMTTQNSVRFAGSTNTQLMVTAQEGSGFSGSHTLNVIVYYSTGTDQTISTSMTGQTAALTSTATTSTTSTTFTFSDISIPSNATQVMVFFSIGFSGTAGANDYVDIQAVQLSPQPMKGFERKSYTETLRDCQHYYYQWGPKASGSTVAIGQNYNATTCMSILRYPVEMRTAPTITFSANNDFTVTDAAGNSNVTAITSAATTSQETRIDATVAAVTAGRANHLANNQDPTNAAIYVTAEL